MSPTLADVRLLRFGAFELDPHKGELRKAGMLVKLPPQPFQVLQLLAAASGELQTREQIQREVWGNDTFVDFDRNLNVCMAQIRAALNDDADSPRFVQTVPRRGYRFVAPVERVTAAEPAAPAVAVVPERKRPMALIAGLILALAAAAYLGWRARPPVSVGRPLLAVLPMENLSADVNDGRFIDGLTEELISQLGGLHPGRLGVIARSSVMRYKGAHKSIDQVARELAVNYVVEGTVQRSGARVRVTARLIQTADQAQVWTGTFEQDAANLFDLEQETAARIAAAVTKQLFPAAPSNATNSGTRDRAAWEAYRNGRYLSHKESRADVERSIEYFEDATRRDPAFAAAYAGLAETWVMLARSGARPANDAFKQARAAAEKAIALSEADAEGHNALANSLFWREWQWSDAERHFQRAIAINPSFSPAHHDYAWFLVAVGRTEDGLAALRRAIALDPLSARINIDAGWLLLQAHRFTDAAVQARRTLALEPGLAEAQACLSRALEYQGKFREAMTQLIAILPPSPVRDEMAKLDAKAALDRFHRARLARPGSPYSAAAEHAALGETALALDSLDAAYQEHSFMMTLLRADPAFSTLHSEPRFRELVRKMGFP
ncbi:MAG: winged helix-turn-helix domain-containing protein [Candidatus Solibacter usitatus]|nr:winged helix-turn-helix domain-containing protein [Candidatus Solibacter usitatus]